MPRITQRQQTQHLHETFFANRLFAKSDRVAHDHVAEVRRIKVAIFAFEKDTANLFRHAIEVVDTREPGLVREPLPELAVPDSYFRHLLPATAVDEYALAQVCSQRDDPREKVLPDHESKPEHQKRLRAIFLQECLQTCRVQIHVFVERKEMMPSECHHADD